eukprot:scaffold53792_cov64-Phaeocystis_antarctica.AAC.1
MFALTSRSTSSREAAEAASRPATDATHSAVVTCGPPTACDQPVYGGEAGGGGGDGGGAHLLADGRPRVLQHRSRARRAVLAVAEPATYGSRRPLRPLGAGTEPRPFGPRSAAAVPWLSGPQPRTPMPLTHCRLWPPRRHRRADHLAPPRRRAHHARPRPRADLARGAPVTAF